MSDFDQSSPEIKNRVTAVLGPTNTGKTHLAIDRMLAHSTGLIGLPLRLLAREVFDKIVSRVGPAHVALITGEERIKPANPRYYVSTVEAMPQNVDVDFLAIDEIQLASTLERGHIFTDRLLHARGGTETLFLGASTMRSTIASLLPKTNFISRPRLSQLNYAGQKKISRLPRRSVIVTFSADDVYAIAELIRRQRGGAAVVLGALSPRTRNAQVALYQSGEVDFLVATDAIGMGLNLDVDHVAFAGSRKFDGQQNRDLTVAELAQIAGRAGRYMNDGTFGVTANVEPFNAEIVSQLETHHFEPVKRLQWRNHKLDFSSLERLKESLNEPPSHASLTRSRMADDVLVLENLSSNEEIRALVTAPAGVRRLWDVSQIPDYRKISIANHTELISHLFKFLMSDKAHIPEDWFRSQVALADKTDGDIDTLVNRIAHIRTWTFVANKHDWLAEPASWQQKTREIEDKLSDALHECLFKRFVDRRTSILMKRMRDEEDFQADISEDGTIKVEDHYVGRIQGLLYIAESNAAGIHGKASRHAAAQILAKELKIRTQRLSSAKDEVFRFTKFDDSGWQIEWQGEKIARIEASEDRLSPRLTLLADEHLLAPEREKILGRLNKWFRDVISERLAPLMALHQAEDISGLARGIAFRLTESYGVLKREDVADEIRALDQTARAQLRKYGIRFGAFHIYFPALLKPAASELLSTLWLLEKSAQPSSSNKAALPKPSPETPKPGLTSIVADLDVSEGFYRAAGFYLCGTRAVRIDMLERLADMIRSLSSEKKPSQGQTTEVRRMRKGAFQIAPEMMSILGCSELDVGNILRTLGFRMEPRLIGKESLPEPLEEQAGMADKDPKKDFQKESAANFEEIWFPKKHQIKRQRQAYRAKVGEDKASERKIGERKTGEDKARESAPSQQLSFSKKSRKTRKKVILRDGKLVSRDNKTKLKNKPSRPILDPDSPFAVLGQLKKDLENQIQD